MAMGTRAGSDFVLPFSGAPEALFAQIADEPYAFFLDSALADPRLGRRTYMGSRPFLVLTARGRRWTIREGRSVTRGTGDPFHQLRRLLSLHRMEPAAGAPPFPAGAVGFASYEAGRLLERIRQARPPSRGTPDLCFAFYESVIAIDLARREASIAATGLSGPGARLAAMQRTRAAALAALVRQCPPVAPPRRRFALTSPLASALGREAYLTAVESVRDSIARGEIYQANLTRTFEARWAGDPFTLYRRLRTVSPAPFASFLNFGPVRILSSSPERFLKVQGGRVETRPIKGTRPRGSTPRLDKAQALELVRSAKDMAEHIMIVDLERNDLGRICEPGSVAVPELAALEMFPQVFHLTSTVEGRLRRGLTAADAFRSLFPGGSITGAPKIRAQEILAELEPVPRGVYTGAIGWFGLTGHCDLSIAIRTITLAGRTLRFGVGGGIVTDSVPEREEEETWHKAAGMLGALGVEARGGADDPVVAAAVRSAR
jgi:para-aminobenzoate synthetase component 1